LSRRSYSKHIPDFRLVTFYAESGHSYAHKASPWTKSALLGLMVLFVIVVTDLYLLVILFLAAIAFYASARLPMRLLVGWFTLPVLFVVTITLMFIFTEPGKQLVSVHVLGVHVALTDNGVLLLVKLLLRALAVVAFSLAVFMTTKYSDIAFIATRTLPKTLANIFLLAYRFTFETSDEVSDVLDAMRARGGDLIKSATRQARTFAGIFGISFVHAFERAERIAKAMEARGFSGEFPMVERLPRPGPAGYAILGAAFALLAVVSYSRYVSNLFGW
jgi:cobalt/nickel transport system permease protein